MIFKRQTQRTIYKGDALWTVVLSQLKTQALLLAPQLHDRASGRPDTNAEGLTYHEQFESFLSRIEDSYDLTCQLLQKKTDLRAMSVAQIAEDVSENCSRRFGGRKGRPALVLVEESLPVVKSYPQIMMRIVDCLVRGAQRLGGERGGSVAIVRREQGGKSPGPRLVLEVSLGTPNKDQLKGFQQAVEKFHLGKYAGAIHHLGLDVCAGCHLAAQLGGELSINSQEKLQCTLDVSIPLEQMEGAIQPAASCNAFAVWGGSEWMVEDMQRLGRFHKKEVRVVHSLADVPAGWPVVLDGKTWTGGSAPAHSVILDSSSAAVAKGQANIVSLPVVSTMLLRALARAAAPAMDNLPAVPRSERPLRVLVVDDTETARIVVRDYLESRGHAVEEAHDGTELVDRIQRGEQFDLAFCDMTMCHMDGLTAVRTIRELETVTGGHLPIALMTAYSALDGEKIVPDGSFDFVVEKPVRGQDVEAILHALQLASSPKHAAVEETKVIELDDLKERCGGKTKTMIRVLDSFLVTSKSCREQLGSDQLRNDRAQLAKLLHTTKGLIREVGAIDGAKAIEDLERKLKSEEKLSPAEMKSVEAWLESVAEAARDTKGKLESEASPTPTSVR